MPTISTPKWPFSEIVQYLIDLEFKVFLANLINEEFSLIVLIYTSLVSSESIFWKYLL